MSTELAPVSFDALQLPQTTLPQPLEEGMVHGVHLVMAPDHQDWILETIERWFAVREDVAIIDYGISDKQELAYILLEWEVYEVDPPFIVALTHEDMIADYTIYTREIEVD